MKYVIIVIVVILVLLLSTFGIQNPYPVAIRFLQWQSGGVPLYILILLSTLIGLAIGVLLSLPGQIQRRLELRRLRQQTTDLEQKVADLTSRLPAPVMTPLPGEEGARRAV